jgi:hypothetical protein
VTGNNRAIQHCLRRAAAGPELVDDGSCATCTSYNSDAGKYLTRAIVCEPLKALFVIYLRRI